jgi:plasmid stability protein
LWQNGAEELTQILLAAEGKKEVAVQAAADATSSAAKARKILSDMLVSVENEVTHARHESMLLQVVSIDIV